jgi:hypothetical protein
MTVGGWRLIDKDRKLQKLYALRLARYALRLTPYALRVMPYALRLPPPKTAA